MRPGRGGEELSIKFLCFNLLIIGCCLLLLLLLFSANCNPSVAVSVGFALCIGLSTVLFFLNHWCVLDTFHLFAFICLFDVTIRGFLLFSFLHWLGFCLFCFVCRAVSFVGRILVDA